MTEMDFAALEASDQLAAKQAERDKVERFILGEIPAVEQLKLFSMPATQWKMEERILRERPDAEFIVAERSREIARQARRNGGKMGFVRGRNLDYYTMSASKALRRHARKGKTVNAVWFDAMGTVDSHEFVGTLKMLNRPGVLDFALGSVPVVATFLVGRGGHRPTDFYRNCGDDPVMKRVRKIEKILSRRGNETVLDVEVFDVSPYRSDTGAIMVNAFFMLSPAGSKAPLIERSPMDWDDIVSTLTPEEMAIFAGVHVATVHKWKNGARTPTGTTFWQLCQAAQRIDALVAVGEYSPPVAGRDTEPVALVTGQPRRACYRFRLHRTGRPRRLDSCVTCGEPHHFH